MISLKTILRSLRRNGLYSVINIAGLVIGMTASALIFLWVFHERSFDRYHPDSERIYLVLNTVNAGNENQKLGMFSPSLLAMVAKENIPEIENTAELSGCNITGIKVNNEIFPVSDQVAYVDKEWFELFEYQLLEGSFTAFGNHPYSIVLTESNARKFFGNTMAIGQTIGINETDYTVQAVVKDNLANSSFQSGILIAKDAFPVMTSYRDNWLDIQWVTFVKLRIDADVSAVSQKINDLYGGTVIKQSFTLRPLTDIHFQTDISNSSSLFVSGNKKIVSIFSMLGILLLLTACINYVNLTTARANVRTKEVGVRKIVGAKRRTLFLQFVAESFVICSIAVVMSLFLNWMLRPVHHVLTGNTVFSISSPVLWVVIGVILLITTLLNGIYPALMLSSFRPTNLMRGIGLLKIKSGNLRKGLVVF
jgi:ABC-type antimicrobial peptide transport system permease subunit